MRVGVIGCGQVGLVAAATLAELGHRVVGTDADLDKLALLDRGQIPFFEPGLPELVAAGRASGRLLFGQTITEAVAGVEVVLICVGTPGREDGSANLLGVETAARTVARLTTGPVVVVQKSTVPAGTAHRVKGALAHGRARSNGVVRCSEQSSSTTGDSPEDVHAWLQRVARDHAVYHA